MNLQNRLQQFRDDNPYDIDTQAKRLLASDDKLLLLYVLALGLATAKQRQRHEERSYIKNVGFAKPQERLVPRPGGTTGSVVAIKPTIKARNAMRELILNVWRINGEQRLGDATGNDLAIAIKREDASSVGHNKNAQFYGSLKQKTGNYERVSEHWNEDSVRREIEKVYGEFRKTEAA
jgi:hypothetical protein